MSFLFLYTNKKIIVVKNKIIFERIRFKLKFVFPIKFDKIPILPKIINELEILEPIIFPKDISNSFFLAQTMLVITSGREVPNATSEKLNMFELIFKIEEILKITSNKNLDEKFKKNKEVIRIKKSFNFE